MKTRQEYFEEMAKDVKKFGTECFGEHCMSCSIVEKCFAYYYSKVAYHFGYRKASDVIDEFVDKVLEKIKYEYENYPNAMTVGTYHQLRKEIKELAAEMRQEVEK